MTSPPTTTAISRQKPRQRPACEECRRRKLRCDGKKPKCSTCENVGTDCDINTNRVPRGPKKGYLTALQTKIATLESRLQAQEQGQLTWPESSCSSSSLDTANGAGPEDMLAFTAATTTSALPTPELERSGSVSSMGGLLPAIGCLSDAEADPMFFTNYFDMESMSAPPAISLLPDLIPPSTASSVDSSTTTIQSSMHITNMMQAELDQLYFDRMHAAVPILHQRRYLSWSKSPIKTKSQICLQYAVWATASLMSAQFQHLQDTIYPELKRVLASTSLPSRSSGQYFDMDIALAQAWVLTATYEFVKMNHHEACISASRSFRLAQLMGLHEMDNTTTAFNDNTPIPSSSSSASGSTCSGSTNAVEFIVQEEKRRVFWMAFTLEALYSMRNNLPLVVNEHMISTILPVPDEEFQNGQPIQMETLGECITKRSHPAAARSPLNECIMLVAMCARTTFHAQQYSKQHRCMYNHSGCDRLEWQQWLDSIPMLRLQTLAQDYPSPTNSPDPTLLFANFLAQASIVYLWREARNLDCPNQGSPASSGSNNGDCGNNTASSSSTLVVEYTQRAFSAVAHTVELARSLIDFPYFKIHPFMTIPLSLTLEFLSMNRSDPLTMPLMHSLLDILRQVKDINSQQTYMDLLDPNKVMLS